MKRRKTSEIWNYFESSDEPNSYLCNYCPQSIKIPKKSQTSNLWSHIRQKHKESSLDTGNLSLNSLDNYIQETIVSGLLPYRFVKNTGFKKLIESINKNYVIPSPRTICRRLNERKTFILK